MKNIKRILCLLLTFMMLLSLLPTFNVVAASTGVQNKLDAIRAVYPNKCAYFTSDGKPESNNYGSSGRSGLQRIPARGGLPSGASVSSHRCGSCYAFAEYVFRYTFGYSFKDCAISKNNTPRVGDVLKLVGWYGQNHYVIYLGQDSTNFYVFDANGDGTCKVKYYNAINKAQHPLLTIYRAPNYDKINGSNPVVSTNNASNVTNYSATVSGSIKDGNASSWGMQFGPASNNLNKTYNNTGATVDVQKYTGELEAGKTYYYKMFAVSGGKTYYGAVKSFTTTKVQPNIPVLNVANKDVATNSTINLSWNNVANAKYYNVKLYNNKGIGIKNAEVTGTSHAFDGLAEPGQYFTTVTAYNNAGTKGESAKVYVEVHPDVTVNFVDYDGTQLCEPQVIGYNASATAPAQPARKGYTFNKWDKSFTNVKENITVTATYNINKYDVTFVDNKGGLIKRESVEYQKSATAPEFTPADGYTLLGWDKDFSCIEEDTTVTANIDWYNKNYSVYTKIDYAERIVDSDDASNEGYEVNISVVNNNSSTTRGRVIVALMTEEGKLVDTTESAAFTVKKNATKQLNVFIPSDKAAKLVKIYTVSQYASVVPIANSVTAEIDQAGAYTSWSTEVPAEGTYYKMDSRTEYRYKTKSTTKSYETSMSGWTQDGSQWVQSGSGYIDYVKSFPSGFSRSSSLYTQYNKTPKTAYENATNKTTVSTSTVGYLYYHWCRGATNGPNNRYISYNYSSTYWCFHAFTRSSALAYQGGSVDAFQLSNPSVCKDAYWWNASNPNNTPIYRCTYTDYRKQFNYYKWSDFSDWSTTQKTADDNTIVETRTVYRYVPIDRVQEDTSGTERVISGDLGAENAGKEITLFIYKSKANLDDASEYIGQTTLDESGKYSFKFKTREEPSLQTGDFIVEIGMEGSSSVVVLDPIEAPKPVYTVNFYNKDGEIIDTQEVKEGESAQLPDEDDMQVEGYRFLNWTESNRNVYENLDIYPNYELKEFTVVFVDWTSKTVSMEKFKYGEVLTTPALGEVGEDQTISWDVEEGVIVQKDMIITSKIEDKIVQAEVLGFKKEVVSTQAVKYDTAVELPDMNSDPDYIFLGWKAKCVIDDEEVEFDDSIITENIVVYPEYVFANTVDLPESNVQTGEYDSAQTIELTCDTDKAVIYYTLDGSDPETSDTAKEYTEPFVVDKSCRLRAVAMTLGMNNSEELELLLAVNTGKTAYHILTLVANIENSPFTKNSLVKDGFTLDAADFEELALGYDFGGFYYDSEFSEEFLIDIETITESVTLYAKYVPQKQVVIFKDYDGTILSEQNVDYNTAAIPPEVSRDGFVFVGWDGGDYTFIQSDSVFTAKYVAEDEYATVKLNRSKLSIEEGKMFTLKATISPAELSDKMLEWHSDNDGVVTVDDNGVVTAVAPGTAIVNVTVVDTGEKAECLVTVTGDVDKAIYLNKNSYLDIDSLGNIRRVDPENNTIKEFVTQFKNDDLFIEDINGVELTDESLVGTGSVVKLLDGETVVDSKPVVLTGDFNGDGYINNKDVVMINQLVLEKRTADLIQMLAIDVNGDGSVNNRDCAMLARYLVGKETL